MDQHAWRNALLADLRYEATQIASRPVTSIFFGGGTPSLMPPETVSALISEAEQIFGFAPDVEITLEANPSSVEAARFSDLATAGVNRASLGLQALDDQALQFLGRPHDLAEGLSALETAQQVFRRVSFDLIYARPDHDAESWTKELSRALAFGTEHLSLYQLTIEPGTRFATMAATGALKPFDPDEAADLFEITRTMTAAAGLPAYEISNHARVGAESRHNLTYWRYDDYLGVGPGAHGRRDGLATTRHKKPENFLKAVARNGHGTEAALPLTPSERAREALLMGLRLAEGIGLGRIQDMAGSPVIDAARTSKLADQGLVRFDGERLAATERGMAVLDAILAEIVTI